MTKKMVSRSRSSMAASNHGDLFTHPSNKIARTNSRRRMSSNKNGMSLHQLTPDLHRHPPRE